MNLETLKRVCFFLLALQKNLLYRQTCDLLFSITVIRVLHMGRYLMGKPLIFDLLGVEIFTLSFALQVWLGNQQAWANCRSNLKNKSCNVWCLPMLTVHDWSLSRMFWLVFLHEGSYVHHYLRWYNCQCCYWQWVFNFLLCKAIM